MSGVPNLTEPSDFEVAQEADVVASRKVSAVMAGGVVVTIASVAVAGWLLASTRSGLPTHAATSAPVAPREISGIHQTPIERDRHGWEQREEQRRSLDQYRWIDRDGGVVQIPIDLAMQLVILEAAKADGGP